MLLLAITVGGALLAPSNVLDPVVSVTVVVRADSATVKPSDAVLAAAVREVDALWRPYGRRIEFLDSPEMSGCGAVQVTFEFTSQTIKGGWSKRLGSIRFVGDRPDPVLAVYYRDLLSMAERSYVPGMADVMWPRAVRDQMLGRMLGRVLAHELGHFMLRMPEHTAGLMREVESMAMLARSDRSSFALIAGDRRRFSCLWTPEPRTAASCVPPSVPASSR
jgi:hypothetical protein